MKTSAKEIQIAPPGLAGDDELVERTVAHHQVGGYFNRIFYRDPGVSIQNPPRPGRWRAEHARQHWTRRRDSSL